MFECKKIKEFVINEVSILSVDAASKILGVNKRDVMNACEVFRQSRGRDGLRCFTKGTRTVIRAGALKEWLMRLEEKEVA